MEHRELVIWTHMNTLINLWWSFFFKLIGSTCGLGNTVRWLIFFLKLSLISKFYKIVWLTLYSEHNILITISKIYYLWELMKKYRHIIVKFDKSYRYIYIYIHLYVYDRSERVTMNSPFCNRLPPLWWKHKTDPKYRPWFK